MHSRSRWGEEEGKVPARFGGSEKKKGQNSRPWGEEGERKRVRLGGLVAENILPKYSKKGKE